MSASAAVTTAYAKDAPDIRPCRQILDTFPAVQPSSKSAIAVTRPDPQTCRFAPISFSAGRLLAWTMDSLTVTGVHPKEVEPVQIEANGIRSVPAIPNPVAAYLNKVTAIPFDIAVTYASDPQARRFTLQHFSMHGELVGTIEVSAALTNVVIDPLNVVPPALPDPATIGLASLSIRLDNHGFVERMLTPFIAGFVASSAPQADLAPLIEAQKQQTASMIAAMPALYGLEPPTAQALARFVMDFPHPTGSLQCSLAADPPLHLPAAGNPPDDDAMRAIITAAHLTCSYTPA